jgi:microcystin-dependent protein
MTYWVASTAPTGWLIRDGSAISRTAYSNLFNVLNPTGLFASQTFTVTIASPCVVTKTAHGFINGERLRLSTTGALPTGLNTTTDYFVFYIDANTFGLCSDEMLVTRINTSGTQSGTHSYIRSLYGLGDGSTTFNLPDDRGVFVRGVDSSKGYDTNRAFGTAQNDDFKSHTHNLRLGPNNGGGVTAMNELYNRIAYSYAASGDVYPTGGTETRPKNRAYLPIIKF